MCGRAAQTRHAHHAAAKHSLGMPYNTSDDGNNNTSNGGGGGSEGGTSSGGRKTLLDGGYTTAQNPHDSSQSPGVKQQPLSYEWNDNYNMSPGMDAMIFYQDGNAGVCSVRSVWGLVNQRGSTKNPLPRGMGKHFSALMFNARADTLYQKPSFSRLASMGRSCLVALDGFFEWKAPGAGGTKGKKQPYFVRRAIPKNDNDDDAGCGGKKKPYLLMAGLWNRVETGWDECPTLNTFTIITTEACQPLSWLHSRMPVCVWDDNLARQWLERPTERVLQLLDQNARQTPEGRLDWYEVTTDMSSTKFRSSDALKPLPKAKSLKDFFAQASPPTKASPKGRSRNQSKHNDETQSSNAIKASIQNSDTLGKRKSISQSLSASPQVENVTSAKKIKTPKKLGTIDAFFKPKPKPPKST